MLHPLFALRWICGVCLLLLAAPAGRAADELEKELLKQGPILVSKLKARGYRNVGVLKFRVKKGDAEPSDRVGELNARLAEKLELALVLASKPHEQPLGIIRQASKVAAATPGISQFTTEGRLKFFTPQYPLAWGQEQVTADALLVGMAIIDAKLSSMRVLIGAIDRSGTEAQGLLSFTVKPDLEDLLDSGESFTLRGVFDAGQIQTLTSDQRKDQATEVAVQTSLQVKQETENTQPAKAQLHPLSPDNAAALVSLEIRYDNRPVRMEFRDGGAFIPEPQEGQRVALIVRRKGSGRERLGIVLKINGENTLFREKQSDPLCSLWVLETDKTEFGVQHFHLKNGKAAEFQVLSQAASKSREIDYGEFVGMISLSIFREFPKTESPKPDSKLGDEDFAILNRGVFPEATSDSLGALRAKLANDPKRNLIADGPEVKKETDTTTFTPDPVPLSSGSVRYYQPQNLPK